MTFHAAEHVAQARICLTLAIEHIAHAALDAPEESLDDFRVRIAAIKNQEAELERLQRLVEPSLSELIPDDPRVDGWQMDAGTLQQMVGEVR